MIVSALVVTGFVLRRRAIGRRCGTFMTAGYLVYIALLFLLS
jgi:hypothetical protein